ncbi:MAG TPA: hypothetical protein VII94_03685 [Candidatus Saccharimonadales bacterium]
MPKKKNSTTKKSDSSWAVKIPKVKESKSQTKTINESVVLSSSIKLLKKSYDLIKFQRKFLSFSLLSYIVLSAILVINISAFSSVRNLKATYIHGLLTIGSNISASLSTLGSLSGTISTSSSGAGSVIQFLLFLIFSLVFIKGIREASKAKKLRFSEGIYSSTYAFIQLLLVILLLVIESIPVIFSVFIYQTIFSNGIAASGLEKTIWVLACGLIMLAGLYLIVSSIFALFIVTLPNMRPWASIRSSWKLVSKRRLLIARKILAMIILLFIIFGLIALLLVLLIPVISAWLLLILSLGSLIVVYSYIYSLYREML